MINILLSVISFMLAYMQYSQDNILGAFAWGLISLYWFLCRIIADLEMEQTKE